MFAVTFRRLIFYFVTLLRRDLLVVASSSVSFNLKVARFSSNDQQEVSNFTAPEGARRLPRNPLIDVKR
jgi:hypothetical protein